MGDDGRHGLLPVCGQGSPMQLCNDNMHEGKDCLSQVFDHIFSTGSHRSSAHRNIRGHIRFNHASPVKCNKRIVELHAGVQVDLQLVVGVRERSFGAYCGSIGSGPNGHPGLPYSTLVFDHQWCSTRFQQLVRLPVSNCFRLRSSSL